MQQVILVVLALSVLRPSVMDAQASTDSAAMLRALDDAVRADPQDHAAWHQRGMLAWSMARASSAAPTSRPRAALPSSGSRTRRCSARSSSTRAPAAPVALDYRTVDASGLERGAYTVTVEVEDLLAKRRITRSSNLTIIE